jgi:hypothetical protein
MQKLHARVRILKVSRKRVFLERIQATQQTTRSRRETHARASSSSTCFPTQCFDYRVAGTGSRDFISESSCTELSISRSSVIRYTRVLSNAVTGMGPECLAEKTETGVFDSMKAAPDTGLATRVSRPGGQSSHDCRSPLRSSFEFWADGLVRCRTNGREDGKTVGLMRKLYRLRAEENFGNSFIHSHLKVQRSGTRVANL